MKKYKKEMCKCGKDYIYEFFIDAENDCCEDCLDKALGFGKYAENSINKQVFIHFNSTEETKKVTFIDRLKKWLFR